MYSYQNRSLGQSCGCPGDFLFAGGRAVAFWQAAQEFDKKNGGFAS
jgi:hypothetical protein